MPRGLAKFGVLHGSLPHTHTHTPHGPRLAVSLVRMYGLRVSHVDKVTTLGHASTKLTLACYCHKMDAGCCNNPYCLLSCGRGLLMLSYCIDTDIILISHLSITVFHPICVLHHTAFSQIRFSIQKLNRPYKLYPIVPSFGYGSSEHFCSLQQYLPSIQQSVTVGIYDSCKRCLTSAHSVF
jgi:hypothetical protein